MVYGLPANSNFLNGGALGQPKGLKCLIKKVKKQGIPGSPVVGTRGFRCQGQGSMPGWGTKISQTPRTVNKTTVKLLGS